MRPQEPGEAENGTFINIRKLAALDIVLHGPKFILAEFGFGVVLCAALGFWGLFRQVPAHHARWSSFMALAYCFLLLLAVNYVPLLVYAILIVSKKNARAEVAFEMAHKARYVRKYSLQQLLLLVPFVVPVLAILQELQTRPRRG